MLVFDARQDGQRVGGVRDAGTRPHGRDVPSFASVTVSLPDGDSRTVATPQVGNGYLHEAMEAGRCLRAGLLESPVMALDDTLALMKGLDTIRNQIGLPYPSDDENSVDKD